MNLQLKKAIFNYMIDNSTNSQLLNTTTKEFRQYIFTDKGEFCIGGEEVHEFILAVDKL
jgi:hypothetical protein